MNYLNLNTNEVVMESSSNYVRLTEQTLTDGSKVYAVLVKDVRLDCLDLTQAVELYEAVSGALIN